MVAWLLDHGADPNRQYVIDLTPLSLAVESAPISVIGPKPSPFGGLGWAGLCKGF